MMNRRDFLVRIGGTLVAAPMVLQAVRCGGDDPAATDTTRWTAGSATVSGHSHTIQLLCTQLTSAGDVVYTSSSTNTHSHSVTLTSTQLASIGAGGSVTEISTADGMPVHQHSWTISKPAGTC